MWKRFISDYFNFTKKERTGIIAAGKKQVTTWAAGDLGLDAGALGQKLTLEALYVPVVDTKVEIMVGDTPEEQAIALAKRLQDAKLI